MKAQDKVRAYARDAYDYVKARPAVIAAISVALIIIGVILI